MENPTEANQLRESGEWKSRAGDFRVGEFGGDFGVCVSAAEHDVHHRRRSARGGGSACRLLSLLAIPTEIDEPKTWAIKTSIIHYFNNFIFNSARRLVASLQPAGFRKLQQGETFDSEAHQHVVPQ